MPLASPRLCNGCRQPTRGRCTTCTPTTQALSDQHRGTPTERGYGSHWRRTIRPAYLRDHPLCSLCGALAEVPDHWPTTRRRLIQQGVPDPDAAHRLRPLCRPCHGRHGPRENQRINPNVTVVAGPPCSGKNTYIASHALAADVVVDFDAIMSELTASAPHIHDLTLTDHVHQRRDAAITDLLAGTERGWIINSAPLRYNRHQYGTRVVLLLPTQTTALERAAAERPPAWSAYIRRWFELYEPDERDEVVFT